MININYDDFQLKIPNIPDKGVVKFRKKIIFPNFVSIRSLNLYQFRSSDSVDDVLVIVVVVYNVTKETRKTIDAQIQIVKHVYFNTPSKK